MFLFTFKSLLYYYYFILFVKKTSENILFLQIETAVSKNDKAKNKTNFCTGLLIFKNIFRKLKFN